MINLRVYSIAIFFSMLLILLSIRIIFLTSSSNLKVLAANQFGYTEITSDINYKLIDKNGNEIMNYKPIYYFVVDKKNFKQYNQEENMEELLTIKYILKSYNPDYDITKIFEEAGDKKYFEIDKSTYDKLNSITGIPGTYCYEKDILDRSNDYSIESMLTNPIYEDNGVVKQKSGLEGLIYDLTKGNEYDSIRFTPDEYGYYKETGSGDLSKNSNIQLTLDETLQKEIHDYLQGFNSDNKARGISAIVMDSASGKILSMTQDDYLLENRNIGYGTFGGFFPGSIFKIAVEAAAFDKNVVSRDEIFTCLGRYEDYVSNHGSLNIAEALEVSCNDTFVQIGHRIGSDLKNYLYKLHLNEKVLDMNDEVGGEFLFNDPNLDEGDITLLSFGQNIRITPIEAAAMANTIVNNGIYVKPSIIEGVVNSEGTLTKKWKTTSERVFTDTSSKLVKKDMEKVLDNDTLKGYKIDGYTMGAKTGTSERMDQGIKLYDGWLVGYITVNEKTYTICVFSEDLAKNENVGGVVCGPVFNKICNMLIAMNNE